MEDDSEEWLHVRTFAFNVMTGIGQRTFLKFNRFFKERSRRLPSIKIVRTQMAALSGIRIKFYDCCPNSCMAYTGLHSELTECRHCSSPRYSPSGKPLARFQYISLTSILRALYANRKSAQAMRYRSQHHHSSEPGHITDVYDSEIYRGLCDTYIKVGHRTLADKYFSDPREVLLAIGTDGFNFFKRRAYT
ncbi:hypothetical protein SISSUDRAFT_983515, partial [Sistotremastrum suecicum HHB10207 ss-3]